MCIIFLCKMAYVQAILHQPMSTHITTKERLTLKYLFIRCNLMLQPLKSNKPPNIGTKVKQSWEKAEWQIV